MNTILITGATGNVGLQVIQSLTEIQHDLKLIAGVRNLESDASKLTNFNIRLTKFDFTDTETYDAALRQCNVLFLLRPPAIAEVAKYFEPLIAKAKVIGIVHIVFLSVQGVEKSSIIPHHKIEKLIVDSGIPYTFLRPAYFMQNFNTTLHQDLVIKRLIFLPAGKAKFTLVDVRDVGLVAAKIIIEPKKHVNQSYELTNQQQLTFQEMADHLSIGLKTKITYQSPTLLHFYWQKKREKVPTMLILVMIMLHYFPRFQQTPAITDWVEKISEKPATSFDQYIEAYKKELLAI